MEAESEGWLTEEIRGLLRAIKGEHVEKKRRTVILLAFALANGEPMKPIFEREDTCSESIWYGKWANRPDVKAAFEACRLRALDWADEETLGIERKYRQERRRDVARFAAKAPSALAQVMAGADQRGSDRINAAVTLIKLADPDSTSTVGTVAGGGDTSQVVNFDVSRLSDEQLDQILAGGDPSGVIAAGGGGTGEA